MRVKRIAATVVAAVLGGTLVVATSASAGGKPDLSAGPAGGFIPSRNANHPARPGGGGHVSLLTWHNGPVMHSTSVIPVYWGSRWSSSSFVGDKVSGLDALYGRVGGTSYARTNGEYTDGSGSVNTTSISKGSNLTDTSAAPSGAPSTGQVL